MKKKKLRKKIALALLILLLLAAAGVYGYTAYYFSEHFYDGSKINGMNCSYKTVEEVKKEIVDKIGDYTLSIHELDDQTEAIDATSINLEYVDDNKVDQLMEEQQPLLWILSFSNAKTFEMTANTTYNKDSVDGILKQLNCFKEENVTAPQDAYLKENETDFEIVPEVVGNTLDYEKVKALVIEAIDQGKTEISLVDAQCYLKPTVYQDNPELVAKRDALNQLAATSITYDFGADRLESINWAIIKTWIPKDDQGNYIANEQGQYAVDENLVKACIAGLASKYDTYGSTRQFKTFYGDTVTLTQGKKFGWEVSQEAMAADLLDGINNRVSETRDAIYAHTAPTHSNNDIGDTYVEISIDNQRMWCYQDGQVKVDTPVVTGRISEGWDTPKGGVWTIFWKTTDYTLKGEIKGDGKPEYEQPVKYWMPFNNGVGIHDIDTREEYGGDIYKESGSHGCVNTPLEAAKEIYQITKVGTPVVVY